MTMYRSLYTVKEEEWGMRTDTCHTQCDYHRLKNLQDEAFTKRCSPR